MGHKLLTLIMTITLLTACNSDENTLSSSIKPDVAQGVFLDSAVKGLQYRSGDVTGVTDAKGVFEYEVGEDVTFFIGDTTLGTAKGAPVLTPPQLASNVNDDNGNTIVNLVAFLQTIDVDANPYNGIQITALMKDVATNQYRALSRPTENVSTEDNFPAIMSNSTTTTLGRRGRNKRM